MATNKYLASFKMKNMHIIKVFSIIAIVTLLIACKNNVSPINRVDLEMDTLPFYHITSNTPQFVKQNQLDSLLTNLSANDNFLFVDLYPVIDTLPPAHEDNFILEERLEELGFEYIENSWGRGNWEKGPRFYSGEFEKGELRCRIYKMYQAYEKGEDGNYNMIVYEQIECGEK